MSNGRRILVVDDDSEVRVFMSEALTAAGFTVEQAEDGHAALQRTVASTFDIIVLDLRMPRMDGRAFLDQYLRVDGKRAQILLCSAQEADDLAGKEPCASRILLKPFGLAQLYAAIEQCTG